MQFSRRYVLGAVLGGLLSASAGCASTKSTPSDGTPTNSSSKGNGKSNQSTGTTAGGGGSANEREDITIVNALSTNRMASVTVRDESGEVVFDEQVQLGPEGNKSFKDPLDDKKSYSIDVLLVDGPSKTFEWSGGPDGPTGVIFYVYQHKITAQTLSS